VLLAVAVQEEEVVVQEEEVVVQEEVVVLVAVPELVPGLALVSVPGSQWQTSSPPTTMPAELTVFPFSPIYLLLKLEIIKH